MNRSAAHTALVNKILADIGALRGVVVGINPSGLAKYMAASGKTFAVPYGWPDPNGGGPDVLACVCGKFVALECRTGNAATTKEQRACIEALRAAGAIVAVVRSVEEAREVIESARRAA
jgi:hypothetical protein